MADDLAHWLEGRGLGQYAQELVENGVNFEALPHLSEDDLKELGLVLGHRRILQAAIEALDTGGVPEIGSVGDLPPPSAPDAELRQLTVLFCPPL